METPDFVDTVFIDVGADLKSWLDSGGLWPDTSHLMQPEDEKKTHWAFQPVQDAPVPAVSQPELCRTPIDNFILARYSARGPTPAGAADKRTLLQRASLDLTGLLPSPKDVITFEANSSPDAFSRVPERLFSSPAFGERWGRHWLDLARNYSNYVINSLNNDLPWNKFLKEQIAGDRIHRAQSTFRQFSVRGNESDH